MFFRCRLQSNAPVRRGIGSSTVSCRRQEGNQNVGEVADQTDTNTSPDSYDGGHLSRIEFHAPILAATTDLLALIYLKPSSDQHRKLALLEHDSRTILCCEKSRLSDGLGRCRMIRLIAIAGFALSVAVSAQAMTPAPIPQPDSMITEVAAACGAGRTRVNGVCVARTTVRQTRRAVRRCATGMTC